MKLKIMYIICGAVFAAGIIGTVLMLQKPHSSTVKITQDGQLLYSFDLNTAEDMTLRIDSGDSYNIIEIKDGKIRVLEAGCPDKTCVNMGWLDSSAPIVCLPNRLVISFAEGSDDIDAAAG